LQQLLGAAAGQGSYVCIDSGDLVTRQQLTQGLLWIELGGSS
jgi:hypothetical protein